VLADFEKPIFAYLALKHDLELDPKQKRKFRFPDAYPEQITSDIWKDCVENLICQPGFCATLASYPGATAGIEALMEIADVTFVTSPWWSSPYWLNERYQWLVAHFGEKQARKLVFTSDKHLVAGDILIEDHIDTLIIWERLGFKSRLGILIDRPHNQGLHPRAKDMHEVVRTIRRRVGR
jgi:5'-nucleotidase